MLKFQNTTIALCIALLLPDAAMAEVGHPSLPGSDLSFLWAIPFICMLLSIAVMPLFLSHIWENHFGKIAAFWGMAFLVPCMIFYGYHVATYEFLHIILLDYIPFLVLLFSLFTITGGIRLKGKLAGTPGVNTCILAVGTLLASWAPQELQYCLSARCCGPMHTADSGRTLSSSLFFLLLISGAHSLH